jgi:tetratricopeptide (TPR) repeat protein
MNRRISFVCTASLLFISFLPVISLSQSINDARKSYAEGRHTITGIVYTPGGKPAGRGMVVKVSKWGDDEIAWTDDDGEFRITGMGNGTFIVTVTPEGEFESESQRVEITLPQGAAPQTYHVNLQLKWKQGSKPKPGVIDAELASAPKKAVQHYIKAKTAASAGDNKAATDELLKAVSVHPEFALAHLELGEIYQKLNDLERSDEHVRTALRLKPGAYEPLAAHGVVLARMKKFAEAETALREAVKIKDESAIVRFYLGRSLAGLKRPEEAEAEFLSALKMGGNSMNEARRSLANIYLERPDNEKALVAIDAYLTVNPAPADEKNLRETAQRLRDWLKENGRP